MDEHCPEFPEKRTASRGKPKFSEVSFSFHLTFLAEFQEFSVDCSLFDKFDKFWILWKLSQDISIPFVTVSVEWKAPHITPKVLKNRVELLVRLNKVQSKTVPFVLTFLRPVFSIFMFCANSFVVSVSRGSTSQLIGPTVTKITIISGGGTISFKEIVAVHLVEITAHSSQPICSHVLHIWRDEHSIAMVVFNLFSAINRG